ncbi:MAG: glutathione synthase, partial [Pseudomonas sp.]
MSIRIGIVMDPISVIHYKKDSSLAMLLAAQQRGWELHYMEPQDLYLQDGKAMACMRPLDVFADPQCWYRLGDMQQAPLDQLDVIL